MPLKVRNCARGYGSQLVRTKTVSTTFFDTSLRRCLTTFDITLIGVGHMIGAGIYVLTGAEAKKNSGPAILISYILAGIASLLSALCYAEFGARVPKAGSAYTYTYVTIGEIWAFIIGWDMVLEYCVGAAAVASSMSGYIWSLAKTHPNLTSSNGTCVNTIFPFSNASLLPENGTEVHHLNVINEHLDWVAVILILLVCIFMAIGVQTSTNINSFFVLVNLAVIAFVVIYGFMKADIDNWTSETHGGFLPFGFSGVMKAGATCFFAYAGFDGIATSGEEAANPSRSIPYATFFAMSIVTVCYCLMSAALTLMIPFYGIDPNAAFAEAFAERCAVWAKYVVSVGAIAGMTTSLLGSMFSLPRTVYAMADDGLIFRCLGIVHPRTKVPIIAIAVFGAFAAAIALVFNVETLVDLLAIGTLNAYSLVSASVVLLRYMPASVAHAVSAAAPVIAQNGKGSKKNESNGSATTVSTVQFIRSRANDEDRIDLPHNSARTNGAEKAELGVAPFDNGGNLKPFFQKIKFINSTLGRLPPGIAVRYAMVAEVFFIFWIGVVCKYCNVLYGGWLDYLLFAIGLYGVICFCLIICMFDQNLVPLRFKVRFVPLVPILSVAVNVILVCQLEPLTWARFVGWLIIGLAIYLFYGVNHSSESPNYNPNRPAKQDNSGSIKDRCKRCCF